jgi:DNA-binding transcriptional regulator LsrR (DeoR family)
LAGLASNNVYDLPLTQVELGECLGLTSVHVNRTLQELRRRELVEFQAGRLVIRDLETLKSVAQFDPSYLYLEKQPR